PGRRAERAVPPFERRSRRTARVPSRDSVRPPARGPSPRLAEYEEELIRLAANLRIAHVQRPVVGRIREQITVRFELEARCGDLVDHRLLVDTMQRHRVAPARAILGAVI